MTRIESVLMGFLIVLFLFMIVAFIIELYQSLGLLVIPGAIIFFVMVAVVAYFFQRRANDI